MIRIENLCKTYEDIRVLDNFSLLVPKGSVYGLMGLNGAGKNDCNKTPGRFCCSGFGNRRHRRQPVIDNEKLKERVLIIPDEVFFFRGYSLKDMRGYYKDIYERWNDERFERMTEDFKIDVRRNMGNFSKKECANRQPSAWLCRLCLII